MKEDEHREQLLRRERDTAKEEANENARKLKAKTREAQDHKKEAEERAAEIEHLEKQLSEKDQAHRKRVQDLQDEVRKTTKRALEAQRTMDQAIATAVLKERAKAEKAAAAANEAAKEDIKQANIAGLNEARAEAKEQLKISTAGSPKCMGCKKRIADYMPFDCTHVSVCQGGTLLKRQLTAGRYATVRKCPFSECRNDVIRQ